MARIRIIVRGLILSLLAASMACAETLPVANGGTGASTAAAAKANLGVTQISAYGTLVAYTAYYMPAGGSLAVALSDASINLTTNPAICIASTTGNCVTAGGTVTFGSWTWTVGGVVYIAESNAGSPAFNLTQTKPSTSTHYIQRIGVALSATTVLVMPGDVGTIQ